MAHFDDVHTLLWGFGTPWYDGLLGVLAFMAFGYLIAWRNARVYALGVVFLAQFIYGTLLMRYALSYLVFHHTLREGLWPAFWSTAAVFGVWMACRKLGHA